MTLPKHIARALAVENAGQRDPDRSPDYDDVAVLDRRPDGKYLVKKDHWQHRIAVPVVPPWADVPYPSRQPMYYENGHPFLYWPFSPFAASWQETGFVDFFSDWVSFGSDLVGACYLPELDDPEDLTTSVVTSLAVPETPSDATIVRCEDGRRVIADGSELREESESTESVTTGPTDLGATIESTHVDADGNICSITTEIVVVVDCQDVFDEAYDKVYTEEEDDVRNFGESICVAGSDYFGNLEGYQLSWLDSNPVPAQYSECSAQWENGGYTAIQELFDEGYTNGGCTVPT